MWSEFGIGDTAMKVKLIGRPVTAVPVNNTVVIVMKGSFAPNFPKGLPKPPSTPTTYVVYMAAEQWSAVAESLTDPANELVIKGLACHDPATESLAVFAQSVAPTDHQCAGQQQV
jgi:hypothetical protein